MNPEPLVTGMFGINQFAAVYVESRRLVYLLLIKMQRCIQNLLDPDVFYESTCSGLSRASLIGMSYTYQYAVVYPEPLRLGYLL